MSQVWTLDWPRGHLKLYAKGGMLDDLALELDDGRRLQPLYRAPWLDEAGPPPEGVLGHLRGDFVCLPWGTPAEGDARRADPEQQLRPEDFEGHGWPAIADWHLLGRSDRHIEIGLEFPEGNALARLRRRIEIDPGTAAVSIWLEVEARLPCKRSVAFHPSFALPATAGAARLEPGAFRFGQIMPEGEDTPVSTAVPDGRFDDLAAVPLEAGGFGDFSRLPLAGDSEEILLLRGTEGQVVLTDRDARAVWQMTWDSAALPDLALWISNRGRQGWPWNGRNLCLGIEPCAAGFGGIVTQLEDAQSGRNGGHTVMSFAPGRVTRLGYRLSGRAL